MMQEAKQSRMPWRVGPSGIDNRTGTVVRKRPLHGFTNPRDTACRLHSTDDDDLLADTGNKSLSRQDNSGTELRKSCQPDLTRRKLLAHVCCIRRIAGVEILPGGAVRIVASAARHTGICQAAVRDAQAVG